MKKIKRTAPKAHAKNCIMRFVFIELDNASEATMKEAFALLSKSIPTQMIYLPLQRESE